MRRAGLLLLLSALGSRHARRVRPDEAVFAGSEGSAPEPVPGNDRLSPV